MDEKTLIQDILQSVLNKTQGTQARHIRVVNLSVYGKDIDPNELTRAFDTLTPSTMAQGAHLHIRRGESASNPAGDPPSMGKTTDIVRLDSLELEDVVAESR